MEIEMLGSLNVRERGMSIVPSAGKPRQILALLALRANRVVPVPVLLEEVWGDAPPRSAATTLQTYILQLRRKIAGTSQPGGTRYAKEVLATAFGGYQFALTHQRCDLWEFERLADQGSAALACGDAGTASDLLARALRLWRGPALADVPVGRVLEMEILGMEESRTRALDLRIEADLRLGRHAELLGELRMLMAGHPLNENLCAQLMLALYRAGQVWRALQQFQELRGTLIAELGVEPSPRLQRLHQAVLAGDPRLEVPERGDFLQLAE
ncbi:BTAD domain-containing putative transcriptional regulator [Streptomyces polygonati]|uniref:BTAD domain-containing putative transcriptional regulator n=1 Tax=Streptomyces polygonati TaxID=1617087 RepID=A0ABV8HL52_9ACTN